MKKERGKTSATRDKNEIIYDEIAAYMDVGMSVEDIAERLGISVEEVQDIALSMQFSQ